MNEVEKYLRENYLNKTKKELAKELNLTYYQVEFQLRRLQLTKYKHINWTEEEDSIMKQHYISPIPYELLYKLLPGRSYTAICKRAQVLKLNQDLYSKKSHIYLSTSGHLIYRAPRQNGKSSVGINLHRKIWKEHYGEIPQGMIVHHKDHNKLNNDISNLCLMTRSEHMKHHWEDVVKTRLKAKI